MAFIVIALPAYEWSTHTQSGCVYASAILLCYTVIVFLNILSWLLSVLVF